MAGESEELMVIGGSSLYAELFPKAERIYLTLIHRNYAGDVRFPAFDRSSWQEKAREDIDDDPAFPIPYSFIVLDRAPVVIAAEAPNP
jgi:dihydrofolate reductase